MATTLRYVSQLADQTAGTVTQNVDNWKHYLTTASRLYKYTYDDQLLIYAQRPDAVACADMALWNRTMHRWVKARSVGIAVIRKGQGRPYLEYLFDYRDTRPVREAREPYFWKIQEEHHPAVRNALVQQCGPMEERDLGEQLMEAARRTVQETYRDHLTELAYDVQGSFLEELDALNLEVRFRNLLTASVQFTLLTRCGLDPSDYLEDGDLAGILEFSTPAVLHHLGSAASTLSKELLVGIERAVKAHDRELRKNDRNFAENPLAKSAAGRYTASRREFNTLNRESAERSDTDGSTDISADRGVSDPGPDAGRRERGGRGAAGQVRDAAGDLPPGAPQRDVHLHAADRAAGAPLAADRPAGPGAGGRRDGPAEGAAGRDRRTESQGPDGLGAGDEQLPGAGGGAGAGGDRLSVTQEEQAAAGLAPAAAAFGGMLPVPFRLFPTVEEQVEQIAEAREEAARFPMAVPAVGTVPDAVIGRALTSGGNVPHSVERIVAFYQKEPTGSAAASYLAQEYGEGGKGLFIGRKEYAVWFRADGFHIAQGKTAFGPGAVTVPWVDAAARIGRLLQDGQYASQRVLDGARENEYRELAQELWALRQDFSDGAIQQGFLASVEQAYREYQAPEGERHMGEMLRDIPMRHRLAEELEEFAAAFAADPGLLRFRPAIPPADLIDRVSALNVPVRQFRAVEGFAPAGGNFITEDEIDRLILQGSNVAQSKLRIASYFRQDHSAGERVRFLREEYGIGGHSDTGYHAWHDGKGITLSRSDDFSQGEYDTVHLSWRQVEKRIRDFVQKGQYLTPAEQALQAEQLPEQEHSEGGGAEEPAAGTLAAAAQVLSQKQRANLEAERGEQLSLEMLLQSEPPKEQVPQTAAAPEMGEQPIQPEQSEPPVLSAAAGPESDLTPNVEEYLNLKAQYPDKIIGIRVGEYLLFYGKDAEAAAPALDTKLLMRDIDGLGNTPVTGSKLSWQAVLHTLMEHGVSVVLAEQDPEHGPEGPYQIIKERDATDYIPIGMELTVEGRRMKVQSVNYDSGSVDLQDLELRGWYPIFRTESIPFVRQFVEEAQERELETEGTRSATDQAAESVPPPEQHNFRITDQNLGAGGQKTKYQNNVAAIRTLKQLEAEGRLAAPEEQEILSRYVGWGSLAQAFDPDKEKWSAEYAELKELLTPAEYESARSTVLNAHYTNPTVIQAIYQAVEGMNLRPGNLLEPSCGIGNFFGLLPEGMQEAKLYGVELDSLTGRIAGQLYQKADITIDGFENTHYPDNFFDLVVGNVPFGEYQVHDRRYDRQNLLIHDYFITKSLDQVRPGGVVAVITSKGTMDKQNTKVRQEFAQKADLLGAIRLPNNAFKANAGTEVTTDILFFQKRSKAPEKLPEWVEIGQTEDGVPLNRYFLQHPEMVLGTMSFWRNLYGNETETACLPLEGADLSAQLAEAITRLAPPDRALLDFDRPDQEDDQEERIPADPSARNFSFVLSDGQLYFRENAWMKRVSLGKTPAARVKGMIAIRDSTRKLIDLQLRGVRDAELQAEQANLTQLYDTFTPQYGLLNSAGNRLAFHQDSSYPLLCSLEVLDEEGQLKRKADMFTKRTIQHHEPVTSVDTAAEALAVSLGERACVDLGYMASLMGGAEKISQIVEDLKGVIFKNPTTGPFDLEEGGTNWFRGWQPAEEYLSGNVREKLAQAKAAAAEYPEFLSNVEALEQVQPKELTAAEIEVRVGVDWIAPKYYQQFIFELLQTPDYLQDSKIQVRYDKLTGEWNIRGKREDRRSSARVYATYGTKRRSAYQVFEDALNQRDTRVYDTNRDGNRVLNQEDTTVAQQKQEAICQAFKDWVFKDPDRRADLCNTYNRIFNSTRPREYNGDHIRFVGMNPEIRLEPHQRNAVARMLYGGNALLAHCVGAGKTFEMTAAAMEAKRLGLCQKSLFVVPNHLTEQWGSDFLTLYPGAKVLVATKKDFEPKNRKKFCARIATGDYDAVILGHSQFEKIPLSPERQEAAIQSQIDEVMAAIDAAKREKAENFTIKQMEKTRKNLEAKLKRLHDKKKDDVVTFEELGVDRLFVDEAHYYKNLYLFTKMRNVAGITQTEAQKSSDMFAKCRYLDELTDGKGVTFATGTPVSNSMVELYTMMRYLQYDMLESHSLTHFDSWAAAFGEKVTAVELKPEGTGFRAKTRFARFYNLPELMNLWKEAADIQTAEMLRLPVPKAEYVTLTTEPSEAQKKMVAGLAERAEVVRSGGVDPSEDNLLKITNDGRKLALDQRLMNPLLPDTEDSKVNICVRNVFDIWQESAETKGAQLVFCDLSTPKGKPSERKSQAGEGEPQPEEVAEDTEGVHLEMSVYQDIRTKLMAKGIPEEEIAFIHDAHTEAQKAELFAKVRAGQVRVLLGSTQKMGAGTNVQTKLVASHDLDCPWRPADLEQRAGRIIRRGNENETVRIYRYVTKGTFDAYNWGLVENKQKFIGQLMSGKSPARSIEDVDATALSYAEVKMLATGDPRIKEKMDLDIQVAKLKLLKSNHMAMKYEMEDKVLKYYPAKLAETNLFIRGLGEDQRILNLHPVKEDSFAMTIQGQTYTERKKAGEAIIAACQGMTDPEKPVELGEYRGFPMTLNFDKGTFQIKMKQNLTYTAALGEDVLGNITRIHHALEKIPNHLKAQKQRLVNLETELDNAKEEAARPFPQEQELAEKSARLSQLNAELDRADKEKKQPEREETEDTLPGEKPSIRQQLAEFAAPLPVSDGTGHSICRGPAL